MKVYKRKGLDKWYCTCVIQDPERQPDGSFVCTRCEKEVIFEADMDKEYEIHTELQK